MCIFCDIVEGKIPSTKIYEDELVLAFLDISQVTKGHTLVIPKKHYDNFLECDEKTLQHLIKITQKLAKQISNNLDCKGINILSNVNEIAGQSVNHFHMHIIPRYSESDAIEINFNKSDELDLAEVQKLILGA